jgi:hypothetical protein
VLNKSLVRVVVAGGFVNQSQKQVEARPYDHFADPAQHRINPAEAGMPRP